MQEIIKTELILLGLVLLNAALVYVPASRYNRLPLELSQLKWATFFIIYFLLMMTTMSSALMYSAIGIQLATEVIKDNSQFHQQILNNQDLSTIGMVGIGVGGACSLILGFPSREKPGDEYGISMPGRFLALIGILLSPVVAGIGVFLAGLFGFRLVPPH